MTINHISKPILPNAFNQSSSNQWYGDLWQASKRGDLREIESILGKESITLADFPGEFTQCFLVAATKGHKDIINFFISANIVKVIKLKWLVLALNSGHKEIVDAVISSIKSDENFPALPKDRLAKIFNAALANDCIETVKAIAKFIEPQSLNDALRSILEKNFIESEGFRVSRYYGGHVRATIASLTPELLWKIIEVNAGIVSSGSTNGSTKVVKAVIESIDPLFLYNALKSSIAGKRHAKKLRDLAYYENLMRITISSLNPELLCRVLLMSAHNKVTKTIVNSISSNCLCQVLHLSLEQNYAKFIKNIIESESILYSDNYGRAFVQAVQNHQIDVVQLFIDSNRFVTLRSEYLDQALAISRERIGQMIRNSDRVRGLNIFEF